MHIVDVVNGTRRVDQITEAVVYFCINHFMPDQGNIEVEVTFDKELEGTPYAGECVHVDDKSFCITVNPLMMKVDNVCHLIETLCHEMVHVKQYVRKEYVVEYNPNFKWIRRWKGKAFLGHDYSAYPWEVEAYALEKPITKKFIKWLVTG